MLGKREVDHLTVTKYNEGKRKQKQPTKRYPLYGWQNREYIQNVTKDKYVLFMIAYVLKKKKRQNNNKKKQTKKEEQKTRWSNIILKSSKIIRRSKIRRSKIIRGKIRSKLGRSRINKSRRSKITMRRIINKIIWRIKIIRTSTTSKRSKITRNKRRGRNKMSMKTMFG